MKYLAMLFILASCASYQRTPAQENVYHQQQHDQNIGQFDR